MHSRRRALRLVVLACLVATVLAATALPAEARKKHLDLHRGSRGHAVTVLEARLARIGLLPRSAVDRRYRAATVKAVKRFQRSHGLRANGRTNRRTWNSVYTAYSRAIAPRPAPALGATVVGGPRHHRAPWWLQRGAGEHARLDQARRRGGRRRRRVRRAHHLRRRLRADARRDPRPDHQLLGRGLVEDTGAARLVQDRPRAAADRDLRRGGELPLVDAGRRPRARAQGHGHHGTHRRRARPVRGDARGQRARRAHLRAVLRPGRLPAGASARRRPQAGVAVELGALRERRQGQGRRRGLGQHGCPGAAERLVYHEHGVPIWTWTAQSRTDLERAWSLGVDSVGTDIPTTAASLYR